MLSIDWSPIVRAVRGRWAVVPLALMLFYFGWHAVHGERGLIAWLDRNHEVDMARARLQSLQSERRGLEGRISGLRQDAIDPDLLEEELRKLGYIGERELIILTPDRARTAAPD
jgi:cell division protein FtsB